MEQTFIMIKPDGVQRAIIGEVIKRFENKGYYLKGMKYINVSKEHAEEHYVDLKSKPFYSGLVEYIISAPVCAMVWEGTIRGDFCIDLGRNIIHGSDAVESAKREIQLWFPEGLVEYTPHMKPWIYE
ncbi:hypothetical protein WJX77_005152 [Trebouxia sp. C0004]